MSDYAHFSDEVLLAVYSDSAEKPQAPCKLNEVAKNNGLDSNHNWIGLVATEFAEKGYWTLEIGSGPLVHLTPSGLRRAQEIRQERASLTFWGRLKSVPRSDWISLAALIVAGLAYFKGQI